MHTEDNRFSWLFLVLVPLIMSVLTPSAHAEGQFAAPPPPGVKYTVRANDTLWEIANRYGITVAQLTAANPDVNPDALRPGQTLTIPSKTPPVSGAASRRNLHGETERHPLEHCDEVRSYSSTICSLPIPAWIRSG